MFRYLRALWYFVTGRFSQASAALSENKYVMAATYDKAIESREDRFETIRTAVADLIGVEQNRVAQVKELGTKITKFTSIKTGAQAAMQKRIDALRAQNKPKEEILSDAEFLKHKTAYEDASKTLDDTKSRYDEKEADLKKIKVGIAKYKAELQQMQRDNDSLREEKSEALADVAISQQRDSINSILNGIPQDTADQDLQAAREARKRVVNRATISAELAGNDAKHSENEYLDLATKAAANSELDGLLNWGEEGKKEDLSPAKLPE